MNDRFAKSNFFKSLFKKFDTQLVEICRKTRGELTHCIDRVEAKLTQCENKLKERVRLKALQIEQEMMIAEGLVNREMKNKIIVSNWASYFLGESSRIDALNPLTFAFTRFSLNICLCYGEMQPDYLIQTKVHLQLVNYAEFDSELVQGPALMALTHLSIHKELRPLIVLAGILPTLCKILARSKAKVILLESCKLCASLALNFSNKSLIVSSGCLHGLLDLVLGTQREIDDSIQSAALSAVLNINNGSNSNRILTIELNGLPPLITTITSSQSSESILRGVMTLANIAFNNSFCANKIVKLGGHVFVYEILNICDVFSQQILIQACFVLFANLSNNENSQSFLGATKGLCEATIRICEYSRDSFIVAEAANVLLALMWRSSVNKAIIGSKGACAVLLKRLLLFTAQANKIPDGTYEKEEIVYCIERTSFALASLLLHQPAHEVMYNVNGLESIVTECKRNRNDILLRCFSQVIGAMVPSPDYLVRCHDEMFVLPIEKINIIPVLKKVRVNGFGKYPIVPLWIENSLKILSLTDESLRVEPKWVKTEFIDRLICFRELTIETEPDIDISRNLNYRGLILSSY